MIILGFEPRTFSVLTKCDNHYTIRPVDVFIEVNDQYNTIYWCKANINCM